MKYRVVASAVIQCGDEILLGKKAPNVGPYPNTWIIPGGGVNLENETVIEALIREMKEETGIRVSENDPEFIEMREDYEPDKHNEMTHYVFLTYRIQIKSKHGVAGDDVKHLQWVNIQDLPNYSLSRPSTLLFTKLHLL